MHLFEGLRIYEVLASRVLILDFSEYINTHPLARGDLILMADQWISNLVTQIGDLILVAKFCHLKTLRN